MTVWSLGHELVDFDETVAPVAAVAATPRAATATAAVTSFTSAVPLWGWFGPFGREFQRHYSITMRVTSEPRFEARVNAGDESRFLGASALDAHNGEGAPKGPFLKRFLTS
jgi:hypothetical protein